MKCSINGTNTKKLHRILVNLGKIGSDVYVEEEDNGISLRTVNSTHSAFIKMHFSRDFFIEFESSTGYSRTGVKVRVSSLIFATSGRNVRRCILKLNPNGTSTLSVQLTYTNQARINYFFMPILEYVSVDVVFNEDNATNMLLCPLSYFSSIPLQDESNKDLTMDAFYETVIVKNYIAEDDDGNEGVRRRYVFHPDEFYFYDIKHEARITFNFRNFQTFLAIGKALSAQTVLIKLDFGQGGNPMRCTVNEGHVQGCLLLSTFSTICDDDSEVDR